MQVASMSARDEGRVEFERRHARVFLLRMPARGTVEVIHEWHDEVERLLAEAGEPIALVHDLRPVEISSVTAAHRRVVAERTTRLQASPHVRKLGADARILSNALTAGAVTAISWLSGPPPWPHGNFSREEDAMVWARARLGLRG